MADAPVSLLEFLKRGRAFLERRGSDTPRLDAEVLLGHVLGCTRLELYTRFDKPLLSDEIVRYRALLKARGDGRPVAYLAGEREFFSLGFSVSPAVLVPRPETEHLVEAALERLETDAEGLVLDAGTGSGCVAISIAKHRPGIAVVAVDRSRGALRITAENARRHGVAERVHRVGADWLSCFPARPIFRLIVSNPPYIRLGDWDTLPGDVRDHEPRAALVAGEDGMACHRRIVAAAQERLVVGGALCLEIGAGQEGAVGALMGEGGLANVSSEPDLGGIPRIVCAEKV